MGFGDSTWVRAKCFILTGNWCESMHFFYFQVPNPKIVIFPYFLVKICASQKTAALNGLQPSNSNRQASFWKTMSACSQIFLGYAHGGILAIQPLKSLSTKPNAPFLASTLCSLLSKIYHWMRWDWDVAVS